MLFWVLSVDILILEVNLSCQETAVWEELDGMAASSTTREGLKKRDRLGTTIMANVLSKQLSFLGYLCQNITK